jgi:hypothetical protein
VADDHDAFLIFETLNDRGLDISIADLLKNYLFRLSGDRLKEAQSRWAAMTGALETLNRTGISVTCIRHLWGSMHGAVRERVLYKSIRDKIKNKQASIDFANSLGEEANLYVAIMNPDSPFWSDYGATAREHLRILVTLQAEQIRPLLLAIVKHFKPNEAKKALRLAVCWSVRFLITGGGGGGTMERNFALRAMEIRASEIKTTTELASRMATVVPKDAEFKNAFATARVSQTHLARYYLRALEAQASGDREPEKISNMNEELINLEHVLPLNPGPEWSHIASDLAAALAKRLGNMVLLRSSDNSKIGRAGFKDKAKIFQSSSYVLTSQVGHCNQWGKDEIDERQRRLADLAVKTWPLAVR